MIDAMNGDTYHTIIGGINIPPYLALEIFNFSMKVSGNE